jgi:hypothetical protein
MIRLLPLLALGCAPLMSAAIPMPLPDGRTAAAGVAVSAPAPWPGPARIERADVAPVAQGAAWATIRLAERWEAGPIFLVDGYADRRALASGVFVRRWLRPQDDGRVRIGFRADAGWAWLGASLDVNARLSDELALAFSPGVVATPSLVAARLPASLILRIDAVDLALELGLAAGTDGRALGATPYGGAKVQVAF